MKNTPLMEDLEKTHDKPIREILVDALNKHDTVKGAAAALSLPQPTLTSWLTRLGITQVAKWAVTP